jgi:hypothetical protein
MGQGVGFSLGSVPLLQSLTRGGAEQMAPNKFPSRTVESRAGPRPVDGEKNAALQNDRPAKLVGRAVPKPFRPRVVGGSPTAPVPPVILWDEQVGSDTGAKPKR